MVYNYGSVCRQPGDGQADGEEDVDEKDRESGVVDESAAMGVLDESTATGVLNESTVTSVPDKSAATGVSDESAATGVPDGSAATAYVHHISTHNNSLKYTFLYSTIHSCIQCYTRYCMTYTLIYT